MKKLPYDKTVVAELKVQLADTLTRSVLLKASAAAPIPKVDAFNSGDILLSMDTQLRIPKINNCIILSSFENFDVLITGLNETIEFKCKGLFVHYGAIDNVLVRSSGTGLTARLQYIWS